MNIIDLRSDTVTKPSEGMLEAMLHAKIGDDVFGEDPTINELQEKCAELTGKEEALFVPTGVMGNQLAIKAHTVQGDEVIVESESHILNYETAGPSVISGVQLLPVQGTNGIITAEEIMKFVRTDEYYFPVTKLICLENTHNRAGGVIQPINIIKGISEYARSSGIKLHLDGARIFNAMVETGISLKEYSEHFDSVNFCFSKGLGCPVGSIICGDSKFISLARKWRKILGGGMRQAGILGAAAIYALDHNINRLGDDNRRAKKFAKELSSIEGIEIDLATVQTNIVIFSTSRFPKRDFIQKLREKGLLISSGSYDKLRAVFHLDTDDAQLQTALGIIGSV